MGVWGGKLQQARVAPGEALRLLARAAKDKGRLVSGSAEVACRAWGGAGEATS